MKHSRHLVVLAVAGVMMLISFAGGATAAKMITGKQIKDGSITTRDIKNGTVNTRDIKNRGVTTRDVRDRTLKVRDIRPAARERLRGATGPEGPQGPIGLSGADGLDGVSGFEVITSSQDVGATLTETFQASCPDGKVALAASGGFATLLDTLDSQVTRVDDDTFSVTGLNGSLVTRELTLDVVCVLLADTP